MYCLCKHFHKNKLILPWIFIFEIHDNKVRFTLRLHEKWWRSFPDFIHHTGKKMDQNSWEINKKGERWDFLDNLYKIIQKSSISYKMKSFCTIKNSLWKIFFVFILYKFRMKSFLSPFLFIFQQFWSIFLPIRWTKFGNELLFLCEPSVNWPLGEKTSLEKVRTKAC